MHWKSADGLVVSSPGSWNECPIRRPIGGFSLAFLGYQLQACQRNPCGLVSPVVSPCLDPPLQPQPNHHSARCVASRCGSRSDDECRLVVGIANGGYSNLWVYDLERGGRMQITFSRFDCGTPIWSRDGSHIIFSQKRDYYSLSEVDSLGAEPPHKILDVGTDVWPLDISPDGRFLLYGEGVNIGRSRSRIWVYPMDGGKSFRLLAGDAREGEAQFSPDGRWVTYTSNESGRDEVYVVPFDKTATSSQSRSAALLGKWQISFSGGHAPRWRRNGRELFYLASDNTITAAAVSSSKSQFDVLAPRSLFHVNPSFYSTAYDVSPDGSRFIVNSAPQDRAAPITVVENWRSDLDK